VPVEVKSGQTIMTDFFDSLSKWNTLAKASPDNGYVVYGGDMMQKRSVGNILGWQMSGDLINNLESIQRKN